MEQNAKMIGIVSYRKYLTLSDGHRTTLVVGMVDMMECLSAYLPLRSRDAFSIIFEYSRRTPAKNLREDLDRYTAEICAPNDSIASSFLSMLIEKSGAGLYVESSKNG